MRISVRCFAGGVLPHGGAVQQPRSFPFLAGMGINSQQPAASAAIPEDQYLTMRQRLRRALILPDVWNYLASRLIGKPKTKQMRRLLYFNRRHKKFAPVFIDQLKPKMKWAASALEESQLPLPRLPEVAFAGRSNCGKSTLLNELVGRSNISKVGRRPGTTQELQFYAIGKPALLCMVDLPGYGHAEVKEEKRLQWTEFTLYYIKNRKNLKKVMVLVDARVGLKNADRELLSFLERHGVKWQIVMTKCDLVGIKTACKKVALLREELVRFKGQAGPVLPVSAMHRQGLDDVRREVGNVKLAKKIVTDGIRQRVCDLIEAQRLKRLQEQKKKWEEKRAKAIEEGQSEADLDKEGDPFVGRLAVQKALKRWGLIDETEEHEDNMDMPPPGATSPATHPSAVDESSEQKLMMSLTTHPLDDRDWIRSHTLVQDLAISLGIAHQDQQHEQQQEQPSTPPSPSPPSVHHLPSMEAAMAALPPTWDSEADLGSTTDMVPESDMDDADGGRDRRLTRGRVIGRRRMKDKKRHVAAALGDGGAARGGGGEHELARRLNEVDLTEADKEDATDPPSSQRRRSDSRTALLRSMSARRHHDHSQPTQHHHQDNADEWQWDESVPEATKEQPTSRFPSARAASHGYEYDSALSFEHIPLVGGLTRTGDMGRGGRDGVGDRGARRQQMRLDSQVAALEQGEDISDARPVHPPSHQHRPAIPSAVDDWRAEPMGARGLAFDLSMTPTDRHEPAHTETPGSAAAAGRMPSLPPAGGGRKSSSHSRRVRQDTFLEHEDLMSKAELMSGKRKPMLRHAKQGTQLSDPPDRTQYTGTYERDLRGGYERKWRMELDELDGSKAQHNLKQLTAHKEGKVYSSESGVLLPRRNHKQKQKPTPASRLSAYGPTPPPVIGGKHAGDALLLDTPDGPKRPGAIVPNYDSYVKRLEDRLYRPLPFIGIYNPRHFPRGTKKVFALGKRQPNMPKMRPPKDIAHFFGIEDRKRLIKDRKKNIDKEITKLRRWIRKHPDKASRAHIPATKEEILQQYAAEQTHLLSKEAVHKAKQRALRPAGAGHQLPRPTKLKEFFKRKGPRLEDDTKERDRDFVIRQLAKQQEANLRETTTKHKQR
ncbi:unnamed protein product [Vitrella brassicaformis CCMP3155]|uniref:EngB-type G domain-containing protein n=3 Tax=Vitrella brassicaformis TaxID=1169539 RepID=A0A0G4EM64_VITBC|nr:unnamed protein product [Vitrella brassicaformis CCMP3155]|eukprot:CEL98249.1 unnamed protein product [Vitrella brassicaformis CCMP3155]